MKGFETAKDSETVLTAAARLAIEFLEGVDDRPVGVAPQHRRIADAEALPQQGIGAAAALDQFWNRHEPGLSGSAGPRYLGFVTGGATPAAVAGDWIAAGIDHNAFGPSDSVAAALTVQSLNWLKELFQLPAQEFDGAFTTGATGANFACLIAAREWAGEQAGIDISKHGLADGPPIRIYSACPHFSFVKVARLTGLGEESITPIARIDDTEAMDPLALDDALRAAPSDVQRIVCASAGTVTTTAFDPLREIAAICRAHNAWLHVDGAFGLFARTVPELSDLTTGIELADSITIDGHKWLNVPYDCGFYFTRRIDLVERATGAIPVYLDVADQGLPSFSNRVLEGSQRFRALPAWMTLKAYGAEGVRQIVRENVRLAKRMSDWIASSPDFELLAPTQLNVVCFRAVPLEDCEDPNAWNSSILAAINASGAVYMTPGAYAGKGGIRAAFSNWRTADSDVDLVIETLHSVVNNRIQERGRHHA